MLPALRQAQVLRQSQDARALRQAQVLRPAQDARALRQAQVLRQAQDARALRQAQILRQAQDARALRQAQGERVLSLTNPTTSSSTGASQRSGRAKVPIKVMWLTRSYIFTRTDAPASRSRCARPRVLRCGLIKSSLAAGPRKPRSESRPT